MYFLPNVCNKKKLKHKYECKKKKKNSTRERKIRNWEKVLWWDRFHPSASQFNKIIIKEMLQRSG